MEKFIKRFTFFAFFLASTSLIGQGVVKITFNITSTRPLSRLDELRTLANSGDMVLSILNTTGVPQTVVLEAEMFSATTNFSIRPNPNAQNLATYTINPYTTIDFDAAQIGDLFFYDSFIINDGINDGQLLAEYVLSDGSGQVESGLYQLCIKARTETGTAVVSNIACGNIVFQQFKAPIINQLNGVVCTDDFILPLLSNNLQPVLLTFTPPAFQLNNNGDYSFDYTVYIAEQLPDDVKDPNQLIQSIIDGNEPRGMVVKKDINGNQVLGQILLDGFDFISPGLVAGHTYAIAIKANSTGNFTIDLPNEGLSQVLSFTYGNPEELYEEFTGPLCGTPFQPRSLPTDLTIPDAGFTYNDLDIKIGPYDMKILSGDLTNGKLAGNGVINLPWMGGYLIEVYFNDLEVKYSSQTGKHYVMGGSAKTKIVDIQDDIKFRFSDVNQFTEFFNYTASETPLTVNLESRKEEVDRAFSKMKTLTSLANQHRDFPKVVFRKSHTHPGNLAILSMNFTFEGATMNVIQDYPDSEAKNHMYEGILNYPVPSDNADCLFGPGSTPDVKNYGLDINLNSCEEPVKKAQLPWNLLTESQTPSLGAWMGQYYMTNIQAAEENNGKYKGTATIFIPWIKEQVSVDFEGVEFGLDIDNKLMAYAISGVAKTRISGNLTSPDLLALTIASNEEMTNGEISLNDPAKKIFEELSANNSTNWETGISSNKEIPFRYQHPALSKKVGIFGMAFYADYAYMNSLEEVIKGTETTYNLKKNEPASAAGIVCLFDSEVPATSPVLKETYKEYTGPVCEQPFQPRSLPTDLTIPDAGFTYNDLDVKIGPYDMKILSGDLTNGKLAGNGVINLPWMEGYLIEVYFNDLEVKHSSQTGKHYVMGGSAKTKIVDIQDDIKFRFSDVNQFTEFFNYTASETPLTVNLESRKEEVDRAFSKMKTLTSLANQHRDFPKVIFRTTHTHPGNLAIFSMNFTYEGATMNVIKDYPDATAKSHLYEGILNFPVPFNNVDCIFGPGNTPDVKSYSFDKNEYDPDANACEEPIKKAFIPWNLVSDSQTPGIGARIGHYYMTNIQASEDNNGKYKGTAMIYIPWIKEQVSVDFEEMEFGLDIDNKLEVYVTKGIARTHTTDALKEIPGLISLTNVTNEEMIDGYTPIDGNIKKVFDELSPNTSTSWLTGFTSYKDIPFRYQHPSLFKKIGIFGMTFYPDYAYMNSLEEVIKGSETTYYFRKNQPASAAGIVCLFEGPAPVSREEVLPAGCRTGNCDEIVNSQEGVEVTSLTKTDKVRIGCFIVTPKNDMSGSANGFNGECTVKLPFLNANFRVNLDGLKVKKIGSTMFAYAGKADGIIDESFPNGIATTLIGGLKEAKKEVKKALPSFVSNVINDQTRDVQNQLTAVFEEIGKTERFISQVSDEKFTTGLPIGYSGDLGSSASNVPPVRAGIFGMAFFPDKATMNLVLQTPLIPGIDQSLYFGGLNICFTPSGISVSDATFYLGGDLSIPIGGTGNALKLKGSGSDAIQDQITFLTLENSGFKSLGLKGAVQFSPDVLVNEDANTPVEASFSTIIVKGQEFDFLATVNVPGFHLKSLPDWSFKLEGVSIDLSSSKNVEGLEFPSGTQPPAPNLWTGIYAKTVQLKLPADFTFGSNQRPVARVTDFILDFGSGEVSLDGNAAIGLELSAGAKLSGLGISLNEFNFKIRRNEFTEFALNGEIAIPIFDNPIPFTAGYEHSTKSFIIDAALNNHTLEAKKLLNATLVLSGSNIHYTDKKLTFNFNGRISVNSDADGVNLPDMEFSGLNFDGQNLNIRSFDISFASPQKWIGGSSESSLSEHKSGGFPVSFKNFKPVYSGNFTTGFSLGLGFTLGVNLVGSPDKGSSEKSWGFGIDAGFEMTGKFKGFRDGIPQFDVPDVTFKETRIDVDVSICHVVGALKYYKDDEIYGNGFRGCIDVSLQLPGVPFRGGLEGMFGSVGGGSDNYRYFFIEGYVSGLNILIPSTPIVFDGFAMGFAYNMLPGQNTVTLTDKVMGGGPTVECDFTLPPKMNPQKDAINVGFALKVKEAASQGFAFNGAMGFSASIDASDGSPIEFGIDGALSFLQPPTGPTDADIKIQAGLHLKYNFVSNVFYGDASVKVEIKKDKNGIDGGGTMAFYFGQNDWYIYLGNPWGNEGIYPQEMGDMAKYATATFTVGDYDIGEAGMYFCMGTYGISQVTQVPDGFPEEIQTWLDNNRPVMDPRASSGAGVAFGAYLKFEYEVTFSAFFGSLDFGLGFDLALVRYRYNPCGAGDFGINNYYATGQIYGYANGELGIEFDGEKYVLQKYDFLAVAMFGGPNPTWAKGHVELDYATTVSLVRAAATGVTSGAYAALDYGVKVADGAYNYFFGDEDEESKGITEHIVDELAPNGIWLDFEIGKPLCDDELTQGASNMISYNDADNATKIISYILPQVESGKAIREIEPNGIFSVIFSKPLRKAWSFNRPYGEVWVSVQRRWVMDKVEIKDEQGNILSYEHVDFSPTEYRYWIKNTDGLRTGKTVTFSIRLTLQEKIGTSSWMDKPIFENSNVLAEDKREVQFTLLPVNFGINPSDVRFSYPVNGQKYFLQQHGSKFIVLNKYMPEFEALSKDPNATFARIYANNQLIGTENFKYSNLNFGEAKIEYYTPTLPNSANIKVEFFTRIQRMTPSSSNSPAKATLVAQATQVIQGPSILNMTEAHEVKIYTLEFKTSKFNNFTEKMNSYRPTSFSHPANDNYFMTKTFLLDEPWDNFEVGPTSYSNGISRNITDNTVDLQPFIHQTTITNNSTWLDDIKPILQAEYNAGYHVPNFGFLDRTRSENVYQNDRNISVEYFQNEAIREETERKELITMPTAGNYEFTFEYQYPELKNGAIINKITDSQSSNQQSTSTTPIQQVQTPNLSVQVQLGTQAVILNTLLQPTIKHKISVSYEGMATIITRDVLSQNILINRIKQAPANKK